MYNYSIVRTNRKNMAVYVSRENEVTVRCNHSTSLEQIKHFVAVYDSWIREHLAKNQTVLDKMKSVYEYKNVYVLGELYPLIISNKNLFDGNCLYVKDVKYINKTLQKTFGESRLARVREFAKSAGIEINSLSFKKYSNRWGCCNRKGDIVFSYATLMLNERLFDYIAVHELCHIFHMDHSQYFKGKLSSYMPDWTQRKRELKEYSFLLSIY